MKAFWQPNTKLFSFGANLSARIFVMIFARLLMRLIGRESVTLAASSDLG
jgi:hypothetical protein